MASIAIGAYQGQAFSAPKNLMMSNPKSSPKVLQRRADREASLCTPISQASRLILKTFLALFTSHAMQGRCADSRGAPRRDEHALPGLAEHLRMTAHCQ